MALSVPGDFFIVDITISRVFKLLWQKILPSQITGTFRDKIDDYDDTALAKLNEVLKQLYSFSIFVAIYLLDPHIKHYLLKVQGIKLKTKDCVDEFIMKGDLAIDIQGTSLIGFLCSCGDNLLCTHWTKCLLENIKEAKVLMFRPNIIGGDNLIINQNISNCLINSVNTKSKDVRKYIEVYKGAASPNKGNSVSDYFIYRNIIPFNIFIECKNRIGNNNNNNMKIIERLYHSFIDIPIISSYYKQFVLFHRLPSAYDYHYLPTYLSLNKKGFIINDCCGINKKLEALIRIIYSVTVEYI